MSVLTHTDLRSRGFIGPTANSLNQLGSVIDVTILGLTILGSCGVLINLLMREFKTRTSTVRTRLLMFLVFSDLFMGVIGILSPSHYLVTGKPPSPHSCTAIGFLLLTSIWTQYINAIVLCTATYIILLHPLSRYVRYLQRYWMWILPIMWGISLIAAGICWRVTGFSYAAGFCYIGDKKGPRFFADYYALCPRAVVFLVVVILYGHLFHFLRRPDRLDYLGSSQSQSDEIRSRTLGTLTDPERPRKSVRRSKGKKASRPWWKQGSRLGRRVGIEQGMHSNELPSAFTPTNPHADKTEESGKIQEIELRGNISSCAPSTDACRKDSNPAPWEKLELHIPETVVETRRLSYERPEPIFPHRRESTLSDPSTLVHRPSVTVFPSSVLAQHRPSVSSSEHSFAQLHSTHEPMENPYLPPSTASASVDPSDSLALGRPIVSQMFSRSSLSSYPPLLSLPTPCAALNPSDGPIEFLSTSSTRYPPQPTHSSQLPVSSSSSPGRASNRASLSSSLTSLHYTISTVDSLSAPPLDHYIPSASAHPARRSTVRENSATSPVTVSAEAELAGSHRITEQVEDDDDDDEEEDEDRIMDFKDMLDDSASPGGHLTTGQSGGNQESLSSFMNRKASLLMILFPIAYVVLFTLSLARIITDLIHPKPIPILSGFSRWGIFASGIVDAILYGLVEWKIKRDVRRQTKRSRQEGVTSELG